MGTDRTATPTANENAGNREGVVIVNFSHPLTESQVAAFENLSRQYVERVLVVPTHCDVIRPFAEQAVALVDGAGLSCREWQSSRLVIVPPSLAAIACLVLAEIHGRAGYFVPVVRLRPRAGAVPPVFEVAEILDVQGQRESARTRR